MAATITVPAPLPDLAPESMGRRLLWGVRDSAALTRRNLLHVYRVPALIVFTALQPIMFTLLFRYVFGGAIRVPGINYVNFLIPGIIVQTAAFGAIGTAIGLSDELSKGVIDRFRSMPISRSAVLIGRLASDMLRNLVTVLILLGVGYGIGFRPTTGVGALVAAVCIAVLFSLAISCISAFIGLAVKDPESVQMFGFIWIFPLTFASNVFAPTASMPGWLQAWVKVNPVSIVSEALRNLTLGGPTVTHVWESFVWMAAIVAVFLTLAVRAYRRVT